MAGPLSQTMLAHRLMAKAQIVAGTEGQLKLLQAIFSAYHEQEMDIGSEDVLADLAEEQGILSRDEVRVVLRNCSSRTCEFLILICVNPYRHFHSSNLRSFSRRSMTRSRRLAPRASLEYPSPLSTAAGRCQAVSPLLYSSR